MEKAKSLSWEEQVSLLKDRGMKVYSRDALTLQNIGFYKIKEFAKPFAKEKDGHIYYQEIEFSEVIKRYYQDKNLRMNLLHAIEQIEVALKTRISYVLGEKYGAFGYLDFYKWANRAKFSRYEIEQYQFAFKKQLLKIVKKSRSADLKDPANHDSDGFPTIWLAMDSIMFGGLTTMLTVMNTKHLKKIASYFDCSGKELISWIKCLNFIRNICAHNSNVIDIKLITVPKIRNDWDFVLSHIGTGNKVRPTNRLAVVICIVITLVNSINDKYRWSDIEKNLKSICHANDAKAELMGFKNANRSLNLKEISKELKNKVS